jgi:hypothetical protein
MKGAVRRHGRVSEAPKLKTLEDENRRLMKSLAGSMLDRAAPKDVLGKNRDRPCGLSELLRYFICVLGILVICELTS